jgi:hypothetical protein
LFGIRAKRYKLPTIWSLNKNPSSSINSRTRGRTNYCYQCATISVAMDRYAHFRRSQAQGGERASERASKQASKHGPGARVCTETGRLRGRLCGRPCCPDERADGQCIMVNTLCLN